MNSESKKNIIHLDEENKSLKMIANPWNKKEHERVIRGQLEEEKELEASKSIKQ